MRSANPANLAGGPLSGRFIGALYAVIFALLLQVSVADNPPKVTLDTSETLFAVLTAINTCGYDQDLDKSLPLRDVVRKETTKAIQGSEEAAEVTHKMCQFYSEHQDTDAGRTLARYVSLALYLNPPPELTTKIKETDLPPDANTVLVILPMLQRFYTTAGLHAIWERHRDEYAAFTERYHEPVAKMLFDTEVYLKIPSAGYLGRQFAVYLDPMGAPGETNARNYGSDYYVVISPGTSDSLRMEQIRHTYLHYLLDPLSMKYPAANKRLEPLLESVKSAPMDASFKGDISLLMNECLIRAIEIRTSGGKVSDDQRQHAIQTSLEQGFVLTRYFYDALILFEKDPAGMRNAYGDLIANIDLRKEQKEAAQVQFASRADPELLHLSRPAPGKLLVAAEQRLSAGDADGAHKLAQQALDEKSEDPGRALFILAQSSIMGRDMQGARNYFLRVLEVAHEPKVVAWSHIYLGRIFDLQEDRPAALDHYRAALSAGATLPEAKAAAQRGLEQPYEPPGHPQ